MHEADGLDLITSFLVVAEELNFRRASERLNLDQSALTRRIQKLEQNLGFRLFERTTREVALTQAGRSFYGDNALLISRYGDRSMRRGGLPRANRVICGWPIWPLPRPS
ncbi:LysR family transcriptional regulator [Paracoccus cavernae]|uniref:LysR family transcriptional regulator n=1 Tax=Paracoccus cavernae TaxID=1571207 RepID=UPI0036276EDA